MTPPRRVVIVGAGLGGAKTAEALRRQGYDGSITLIGAETLPPYERPPLSKDYLTSKTTFDQTLVHPTHWYTNHHIDLRLNTRVTAINTTTHHIHLDDTSTLTYDKLVLATGSTPRPLPVPGANATGVHYLRTRHDADTIRTCFGPDHRLVIIGSGWIGLEVAAAARTTGTDVTVLGRSHLPLLDVLGPQMAHVFATLHHDHGVDLRTDVDVQAILTHTDHAIGVQLSTGDTIITEHVIVGIGATPNLTIDGLDTLATDNGLLVDPSLRTSYPDIYAVGDIANHDHPILNHRIRLEHWAAALHQPRVAAAALLGGTDEYTRLPYFYSDQYDLGMEYVGWGGPGSFQQVVVRGDLAARRFVAFGLDPEHRIRAAMNVNVWNVPKKVEPLIAAGTPVDPDRLADPEVGYDRLAG